MRRIALLPLLTLSCGGATALDSAGPSRSRPTVDGGDAAAASDAAADVPTTPGAIDCSDLPLMPVNSSLQAVRWFSLAGVFGLEATTPPEGRIRTRRPSLYIAAGSRPIKIVWQESLLCLLGGTSDSQGKLVDLVAPAGSSSLVALFGTPNGPRTIRASQDDGQTWSEVRDPLPPGVKSALPAELVFVPSSGARPERLFATYGGPTLDVSEDRGVRWTRLIDGTQYSTQAMTVDTAQEILYFLTQDITLEYVYASWLPVGGADPLPTALSNQPLGAATWPSPSSAEADPWDPHAIYIGGGGAFGYLVPSGSGVQVDLRWTMQTMAERYDSPVLAIWPDPQQAGRVLFGGMSAGVPLLYDSPDGGRSLSTIPFEDNPSGSVVGIGLSPDRSQIVITVALADRSLAVYLLAR
jgi:hypothetical protein